MSKKYWHDKLKNKDVRVIKAEGWIYYDELSEKVKKKRLKKKVKKMRDRNYKIYGQLIME